MHDDHGSHDETFLPKQPRKIALLPAILLFVSIHSFALGAYIYFFTADFYFRFFGEQVEQLFFVRQAGLFLICLGLFYILPLVWWDKYHRLVLLIAVTKLLAAFFLVTNADLTPASCTIKLSALGDGMMAVVLLIVYHRRPGSTHSIKLACQGRRGVSAGSEESRTGRGE